MEENNFVLLVTYQDNLIQLEFDENANVGHLKEKIAERTGVAPADQQLVWGNAGISDSEITSDIPLAAMGIEDAIMLFEKEKPKPKPPVIRQPSTAQEHFGAMQGGFQHQQQQGFFPGMGNPFGNGFGGFFGNGNQQGNQNGNQQGNHFGNGFGNQYGGHYDFDDDNEYHPYLDGRTAIGTNPNAQFGIGSSITGKDFQRLLDVCETDAELFIHLYEEKFGLVHPDFNGGPFSIFYQANKNSKKPIIIMIQNQANTDNVFFNSLVISNPQVVKFLKETDVKFWVGEMTKDTEKTYQNIFGIPMKYPFCAIVGNINNNFTVIDFVNELCPFNDFIKRIGKAAAHIENEIEKKRREAEIRDNERRIREEQNELYKRSQREDRMKEEQKQEEAEMAIVSEASKQTTLKEGRKYALDAAANLPKEPDAKSLPKPTRIMITLVDGTKVQRFFDQNSKLESVFIWVSGLIAERLTDETFLDDKSPPYDAVGEAIIPWTIDAYELVLAYPKKTFTMKDANSTLLEVGLAPHGGVLIFQRI
jgi:hypothetical protein